MKLRRLGPGHEAHARAMFAMMAQVFAEDGEQPDAVEALDAAYVRGLLQREDFWAVAALEGENVIGGITAHTLPMTRSASSELFIYDLAVRADRQRLGIGRALVNELLSLARAAGITVSFVPADNEDTHALDFYRAIGGAGAPVTIFTFSR
jgi:aminoglycoside 3-N-acetyltransferase I